MSIFKLTASGRCDVTITLFNAKNQMVLQRSSTFLAKPTVRELKKRYQIYRKEIGAIRMRITTTPSCEVREYAL